MGKPPTNPIPGPVWPSVPITLPDEVRRFMESGLQAAWWDGWYRGWVLGLLAGAVIAAVLFALFRKEAKP